MSPTTEDLRRRMADELDALPDLPDLSAPALAGGLRRQRRRRYAVALAATGLVVAAVVPAALVVTGRDAGAPAPDRSRVADTTTTTPAPVPDPALARAAEARAAAEADGSVTRAEWDDAVTATLDALLPPRFGGVELTGNDAVTMVRTRAGTPHLDLWMGVNGYAGSRAIQPGSGGCPQVQQAADESDFTWTILDCADARFGDGFQALATTERVVGGQMSDSPGVATYAGGALLLNDALFVEIGIKPVGEEAPLTIRATELVDLLRTPDFLDLVRVGVIYARDRTYPANSGFERVDPVWPG